MIALLAATLLTAQPVALFPRSTRVQLVKQEIALVEESQTSALWYLPAGAMYLGGAVSMIAGVVMVDPGRCNGYYAPNCDALASARPEAFIALGTGAVLFAAGLVLTLVVDNLRYPANARLEQLYRQLSAVW
jgi:hypothetical protein